jgi:chromosome segregation ATPase
MFPVKFSGILFISAAVLLPSAAFSEVKIELKNGRTVIADFCEQAGEVVTCSKMGGTFDLEKKDIAKMKEITGGSGDYEALPAGRPDVPQEVEQGKKDEGEDGGEVKGVPAGAAGRIEEIRKRKSEIAPEREKLLKEREQLQEDLKKSSDWMPVSQYEELQKRNAELDEKIRKYNEEVGRLNREEKNIVDESTKEKD